MWKRSLAILALSVPAAVLLLLWLVPGLDQAHQHPILHFYLVTFFTFAAAVVTLFVALALSTGARPRHRLLATAAATMGAIFLVHGVLTPGAIFLGFNPGITWAAWLTLFVGGALFAVAAFDTPRVPLAALRWRRLNVLLAGFFGLFVAVVLFRPDWLSQIDQQAAPWHRQVIFWFTLVAWAWAALRLWSTARLTGDRVDAVMSLIAAWMFLGTISLYKFGTWHLGWWVYHVLLLAAAVTAIVALAQRYEQLRQFRLTGYFGATSMIATAALALLASHLFARQVEQSIVRELSAQAISVAHNLAANLVQDLPAMPAGTDLGRRLMEDSGVSSVGIARRLTGLDIGRLSIFGRDGTLLYGDAGPVAGQDELVAPALAGASEYRLIQSAAPLHPGAEGSLYLEVGVPIYDLEDPEDPRTLLGVLTTLQSLPGLESALVRARGSGLAIAGLSMGLLFLALLGIVRRSDHLISSRGRELAQAYAELQAAETKRDELTDMIVHDLRSPLTAIKLNLDLLRTALASPDKAHYRERFLNNAGQSVQRTLNLIGDMLNVARLEDGRLHLNLSPVQPADLVREQVALHRPVAEAVQKQLRPELPDGLPAVWADRELITRVMDNLIGNALKYTPKGGRITLRAEAIDGGVQFQVQDTGVGMSADEAQQVFDKYYQAVDEHGRPRRQGTGLGLAFCRLVVEAHCGRIWVQSAPAQGAVFSFTLPLAATGAAVPGARPRAVVSAVDAPR